MASSIESLRKFVNERLTAAAEEIFRVFQQKIDEYEGEIDRQRRLLDDVWGPKVKLHRIEFPQQPAWKEEAVFTDQLLCNQERNSNLDQEDPEPPQIKEEQEELCRHLKKEQLVVKQETDTFMVTPIDEEHDNCEDQTLDFDPDETIEEPVVNLSVITSVESDPNDDLQRFSNSSRMAQLKDEKGDKHENSQSTRDEESEINNQQYKSKGCPKNLHNHNKLQTDCKSDTGKKSFVCSICGKVFRLKSTLQKHLRVHTGERPYVCTTCGKAFKQRNHLCHHLRIHTGEKPYICKTCGKAFRQNNDLSGHKRIHTGEKPYICKTCGKAFRRANALSRHTRMHTCDKP